MSDLSIHIKNLEAQNYDLVQKAITFLSEDKDEFCSKQLIECLNNGKWIVRKRAAQCLTAHGPKIAKFIIPRLRSTQNENINYWGVKILAGFGNPYEKEIIQILDNSENTNISSFCIESLSEFSTSEAVEAVIRQLGSDNWFIKTKAAEALEKIGKPAVTPLKNAFKNYSGVSENSSICSFSLQILAKIEKERIFHFLKDAYADKHYLIRSYTVKSLATIETEESVKLLIRALSDSSWIVRKEAEESIITIGRPAVSLLKSAFNTSSTDLRYRIIQIFGRLSDVSAMNSLESILKTENYDMKYYAMVALAESGNKRCLRLLIDEFKDELWILKKHASDLIVEKIGVHAVKALVSTVKLYKNDPKFYEIQYWCIQTLAKIGGDAFKEIVELLEDDIDLKIKTLIFEIIEQKYADEDLNPRIILANLKSKSWVIRKKCAEILAKLGNQIIPQLIAEISGSDDDEILYWGKEVLVGSDECSLSHLASLYSDFNKEYRGILLAIIDEAGAEIVKKPADLFKMLDSVHPELAEKAVDLCKKANIRDAVYALIDGLKRASDAETLKNISVMDILIEKTPVGQDAVVLQLWYSALKELTGVSKNIELQRKSFVALKKNADRDEFYEMCTELLIQVENTEIFEDIIKEVEKIIGSNITDYIVGAYLDKNTVKFLDIIRKLPKDELKKVIFRLGEKNWQRRTELGELIFSYADAMFIPLIEVYNETREWFLKENITKILSRILESKRYLFTEYTGSDSTVNETIGYFLSNSGNKEE